MKISKILLSGLVILLSMGFVSACSKQEKHNKGEVELTREEKQKIRKQEETLALFLVNHFEGIKKIKFLSVTKGGFGTSDTAYMLINDKISVDTDLRDTYDIKDYSLGYKKGSEMLIKKEKASDFSDLSTTDVQVKYYGEKDD